MSHISTMQTSVKFKNSELLSKALANIPGGTVGNTIKDYYGNVSEVEISVKTDQFERGIGFDKTNEEYIPQMDKYGYESASENLMATIQTQYRKVVVQDYYQSKGFSVEVQDISQTEAQIQVRGY